MDQKVQEQLDALKNKDSWSAEDQKALANLLLGVREPAGKLREIAAGLRAAAPEAKGAAALKIGILRTMLCQFAEALTVLGDATDNKERRYFQGLCHKHLREYDKALANFEMARDRGWEAAETDLEIVEVRALGGELDDARAKLKKLQNSQGSTAQFHYLAGLIAELGGEGEQAADAYEKAREIAPEHAGATFRLAYYLDLHGDEQQAIELYQQCVARPPVHVSALLNLSVLHEDLGQYDLAARCLRRILAVNPNHARARLFLRDVDASTDMYYDEDQARRIARRNAVLDIPVTDFELSVRARNCLKKMNIRTLGDLVRTSESELLGYKNFGETSLKEIKDMLAAKGLRLGQALEEGSDLPLAPGEGIPVHSSVANEGVLATAVSGIDFSIRARKALEVLRVRTLGDLAAKTEAELLACRNFGQTSLNEIRQRLGEYGLHLREP